MPSGSPTDLVGVPWGGMGLFSLVSKVQMGPFTEHYFLLDAFFSSISSGDPSNINIIYGMKLRDTEKLDSFQNKQVGAFKPFSSNMVPARQIPAVG